MAQPSVRRMRPSPAAPTRQPPAGQIRSAVATIRGEVSHRGEIRGGKEREETLLERTFPAGVEPASVRVGAGLTISTGNFEFLRIDVSVTLPCLPSETREGYEQASEFVADFLNEEEAKWLPPQ